MTAFIPKKLNRSESLGEKLRQARFLKKLDLNQIAKKIPQSIDQDKPLLISQGKELNQYITPTV